MTENLSQRIAATVEELMLIPDRQERMAWVIERGKKIPGLPAADKVEANRVPGCVSAVWLRSEVAAGRLLLKSDAESPLVRGLVHFLVDLYDGTSPEEILVSEASPLEEVGLLQDLSPTRQNGLIAVRARIRQLAAQAAARGG